MKFPSLIFRKYGRKEIPLVSIPSMDGHFGLDWNKAGTRAAVVVCETKYGDPDEVGAVEGELSATAILRKFPEAKVVQFEYGGGGGAWFAYRTVADSDKTRWKVGESRVRR